MQYEAHGIMSKDLPLRLSHYIDVDTALLNVSGNSSKESQLDISINAKLIYTLFIAREKLIIFNLPEFITQKFITQKSILQITLTPEKRLAKGGIKIIMRKIK